MTTVAQRSFAGGELAPSLQARVDLVKYATGLRKCRNFFVQKHGGVTNRPGTEFICEVKDSTKRVKKIPFIFNDQQTYSLEFGDRYMRVIREGVLLEVSNVTAWSSSTAYVVGDVASRLGVNYYCIAAHSNQQPPNVTYWYAMTGDIYEIPTPYFEADLPTLQYNQSADIINLTHQSYEPRELQRHGHTTWILEETDFAPEIAAPANLAVSGTDGTADKWVVTTIADDNFEESLPTAPVGSDTLASSGSPRTLTWDAVTGAKEYSVYKFKNGIYGFVGVAGTNQFIDDGITADMTETPPAARNPFSGNPNFTDSSSIGHIVGNVGAIELSTVAYKFSPGSVLFDGASKLTIPRHASWNWGTGVFAIEFWLKPSVNQDCNYWLQRVDDSNFIVLKRFSNKLNFLVKSAGVTLADYEFGSFNPSLTAFTHVAIVRDGTDFYMFVDGVEQVLTVGTAIASNSMPTLDADIEIGSNTDTETGGIFYYSGCMDEYRVSKGGTARYTGDFTPSSTPFTDDADTELLLHFGIDGTGNFPATSVYHQQRLGFGNTPNYPVNGWFSRSGHTRNFTKSFPLQDDDAVDMNVSGKRVNAIKHMLDLGSLIVLTAGAEILIQGDTAGILRPGEVNPKPQSYNGSADIQPLLINDNALYVQARGSIIRDLFASLDAEGNVGYRGNDLTVFASHLFLGYTIVDWAYQQTPHSIVWAVRSDGKLLGLTYLREHQIWAWHQHDFDGEVENVCCVPEGGEDRIYLVIKRTVDGEEVRYIERMASRQFTDIRDAMFLDSALTYDGRNTDTLHTMTLSGSGWLYTSLLTLTSNEDFFVAGDVGNEIQLTGADGTLIRFRIEEYTSATVVTGRPNKTVPAGMQATAITTWAKAVDEVSGLEHLEGEEVGVFADGFVVASPNNPSGAAALTVASGAITLPKPCAVIHVGRPIIADIETLNIDTVNGETLVDKKKCVSRVTAMVEASRGIWAGPKPPTDDDDDALEGLFEYKARDTEGYDDPVELKEGDIEIIIQSEWNSNGRVFVRQVDPLPLTILGIMPTGLMPFRG